MVIIVQVVIRTHTIGIIIGIISTITGTISGIIIGMITGMVGNPTIIIKFFILLLMLTPLKHQIQ
jgi:hypothetical protein